MLSYFVGGFWWDILSWIKGPGLSRSKSAGVSWSGSGTCTVQMSTSNDDMCVDVVREWNNQEVESICDDWNCVKQRQSMRYECTLLSWFVRQSRASDGAWTWLCCHHHMASPCMHDCHKSSPASKQVMNDLISTTWACACLVLTKSLITCLLTGLELWIFLGCHVPVHPLLVRTPYAYSYAMPASVCWCRWVTFSSVLWEQLNFNRVNKTFTNWSLIIANDQKVQVVWLVLFG